MDDIERNEEFERYMDKYDQFLSDRLEIRSSVTKENIAEKQKQWDQNDNKLIIEMARFLRLKVHNKFFK